MPQAVLPLIEVTVAKEQPFVAAPVAKDPRDAQIAALEKTLQSLQSTLEKMQTATASASLQQSLPPPPIVHSLSQQYALPAALSRHETTLLPADSNRLNQSLNQFPISAYNEPDAMCNFLFRMQQHNFENQQFAQQNHQLAQQRTIERLELENFIHLRQVARNNQTH